MPFVMGSGIIVGVRKNKLPPEVRAFFVQMGKIGGKLGGPARAAKLTAEQRSENARKAVSARWERAKAEKRRPRIPGATGR